VPGETILSDRFDTFPGGKGANQAVAAARLGGTVVLIGRLGTDGFAEELQTSLNGEGIDTSRVHHVHGPSGNALITVTTGGQNTIVVTPGANAALQPQDLESARSTLADASMVLVQLETPLDTVERLAELCAEAGIPLMLDPAPAQALSAALLKQVTWLTPNQTEAAQLLGETELGDPGEAASRLLATGVKNVALKLGEHGVYVAGQDVAAVQVPGFPVTPVDTTAAGDCFNGAFAVALAQGLSPADAARFACAAAALSTTMAGAQPSMPRRDEVVRLLSQ
jgi:ribokinase